MKTLAAVLLITFVSSFALASVQPVIQTPSEKLCEALKTEMSDRCDHIMCDGLISDGTFKDMAECTGAEDYAEAAQGACDDQPTLEDVVLNYNRANPNAQLTCEG